MASSSADRPAHCRSSGAVHAWLDPTCFTPGTFPDPCSGGCSQAWYNQSPRPPSPRCQPNRLSPQPVTCVARGSPGPSVCSGRGPAPLLRAFQQRGSGTSDAISHAVAGPSVFLTVRSRHLHSQTDLCSSCCQTGLEFAFPACFRGPFPFLALWSFTWD